MKEMRFWGVLYSQNYLFTNLPASQYNLEIYISANLLTLGLAKLWVLKRLRLLKMFSLVLAQCEAGIVAKADQKYKYIACLK